ncbi:MAG: carboxypeptidase regulatory-like domain-containing protein [Acidobacteriia bacterium]|nr:carboxypeptidase regulatory-like domain-containing protein [Terriglobia bacterium]
MKSHRGLLRIVLLVVTFCGAAWAQDTGSITGTVKDPTGAAVPNADVVVTSPDHGINRHTVTNSSGDYNESALPGGTYDVIVTVPGFKKYQAKGVKLDVAEKARVDVTLQVGAATTEVLVEGTEVAQVETQSSELAGTVTGKEISQLELNGRNFTQLVTLTPGVSNQTGQDEGTVGVYGNVSYSMNGGRVEYNNWELDGGDNMDNGSNSTLNVYPSIEAIAEFKVLTSNYGAQYGRNGSGTVEVETKSGTRQFHGNVYEFVRNDAFNSPAWFQGGAVPTYKKNDYGYTFGGPIYIPGHFNKDKQKTFFFWSEEWRKDLVPGQTFNQPVPSLAERGGDFTDLCVPEAGPDCPTDPRTGLPFDGSLGPLTVDPAATALLGMIPEPTGAGASTCIPGDATNPCFFNSSPAQMTNWREELIRVDHNFSDKIRATFRYIHDSWQTETAVPLWTNQGSFPTVGTAFKGPGVSLVARLTASVSPTLLNEFVFSYTVDHIILNNTGNWKRPADFSTVFHDLFPGNGGGVLPGINLVDPAGVYGDFGQDAGYIPNGIYNSNPTYTYRDNLNKIIGKHNLQMGVYMAFAQKNEFGGELAAGSYPGYLTFDPNSLATTSCTTQLCTTGNPFADLLVGNIASFGQQDHLLKYYNRYKLFEPYFQDDWRITNRLTLNLGIRISGYETYREKQKQAFNFDPAHYIAGQTSVNTDDTVNFLTVDGSTPSVTNLPNGIVQCGVTSGVPDGCMKPHWFNPAPRIGFAWDPFGNGKWAIRGGYGIFFEHTNGNEANTESLENSPPLATTVQQTKIAGYTSIGGSGGGPAPQFPLNVNSVPDKVNWPYMQQWHLDVQHDIAHNTVGTISYVGSKGTHLTRQSDMNQLLPTPLSQNPYKLGEAIGANDCGPVDPITGAFPTDANGVPTQATTPSGVPVPYGGLGVMSPAVNLGVSACNTLADLFRPFPGYGTITKLELESSSIYHALQASLRRSVGQLTLSAAYTWSHSIDDSSDRGDGSLVNSYDFTSNRASSTFDQRHIFNFSYVWDVPFFRGNGLSHTLLGGWQFSGIVGISTGTPFSVLTSNDNAGVAAGVGSGARADIIGNPNTGFTKAGAADLGPLWYNPAAYAAPQGLTFGNSGRDSLRNLRRTNFDMALFKHFQIRERLAFEFRAEAFNVFNHTEWSGFASTTISDSNFLFLNSVHNARILQLGAKLMF